MRAASNYGGAADAAGFHHWKSPVPYLFGGLALMIGLIAMALLILACSYKKSPPPDDQAEDKSNEHKRIEMAMEMEPKIVVIMAGDLNPSFLANPVASCTCHTPQV